MLKKRLIATLLARNGRIVQSINFKHTNVVGNAITAVDFFNTWAVDEIVILDVSRSREARREFFKIINGLSERCFVPLTVGGWITTAEDIQKLLALGADKVVINTQALKQDGFIAEVSRIFGNQCIVVSIDAKVNANGEYEVYTNRGKDAVDRHPLDWAQQMEKEGAGELYVTSIDQDGDRSGYDIELIRMIADAVDIPVIASGGVGNWQHLVEGITKGNADAVSAANIFHFTEHSTKKAKEFMMDVGIDARDTVFFKNLTHRKPQYEIQYRV